MRKKLFNIANMILTMVLLSGIPAPAAEKKQDDSEALENRMELILEFDAIVAQYFDLLFAQKVPDVALMEWCEKTELRAVGYPKVQQAFGELYDSIKSCIKGETVSARMSLQQALWLMASERYAAIQSVKQKAPPKPALPSRPTVPPA